MQQQNAANSVAFRVRGAARRQILGVMKSVFWCSSPAHRADGLKCCQQLVLRQVLSFINFSLILFFLLPRHAT